MTVKTTTCAMAVALLAGTACFAVPTAAQSAPLPSSHHSKRLFMSAVAVYDAGLRQGTADSTRSAYPVSYTHLDVYKRQDRSRL